MNYHDEIKNRIDSNVAKIVNLNIVKALVYFKEKWELQIKNIDNRLSYEIESLLDTEEYEENEKRFCKYFDTLYEYAKDNQDIFINFEKVDRAKPIQEPSNE